MTLSTDTDVIPVAPGPATSTGFPEGTTQTRRRSAAIWALVVAFAIAVAALGAATFADGDSNVEIAPSRAAVAERIEREAKLDGQARTYLSDTADDEFVAGSRSMPTS